MDPICVPAGPADAAVILGMMREYYPIEGVPFRSEVQGPALQALLAERARAVYEKHGFSPTRREMMPLALVE